MARNRTCDTGRSDWAKYLNVFTSRSCFYHYLRKFFPFKFYRIYFSVYQLWEIQEWWPWSVIEFVIITIRIIVRVRLARSSVVCISFISGRTQVEYKEGWISWFLEEPTKMKISGVIKLIFGVTLVSFMHFCLVGETSRKNCTSRELRILPSLFVLHAFHYWSRCGIPWGHRMLFTKVIITSNNCCGQDFELVE